MPEPSAGSRVFTLADVELTGAGDRDALIAALNLRRPAPVDPMAETDRIELPHSLWPSKRVAYVRPLRWEWKVTEQFNPDAVLAQGHALTERGAWRRGGKAARRIRDERAEAQDAEGGHG